MLGNTLLKPNKNFRTFRVSLLAAAVLPVAALIAFPMIAPANAAPKYVFENLGKPVRLALPIQFATTDAQNRSVAWGGLVDDERRALVGVRADNGELITVDLTTYGMSNTNLLFKKNENTIFMYGGNPGRFFKYEIAEKKLTPLSEASKATYWMAGSHATAPNGKIYVGTYPGTGVAVLDPATEKTEYFQLTSDKQQAYVIHPTAADNGMIYLPVGLHHPELYSYNPATGEKKQILPASMQKSSGSTCSVWTGIDGKVYGRLGGQKFLCNPDGITLGLEQPERPEPVQNHVGGQLAREIDGDGRLVLVDRASKKENFVSTSFQTRAITLFSIGDEHKGKIYGSSIKPGHTFSFDLATGKTEDLGLISGGRIQVYDYLSHGDGLFLSSYTGSYYDFYNPSLPRSETNPRRIGRAGQQQERPLQLVLGSDGMIYSPNIPVKGQLGGALTRIDPKTFELKTWRNIVPKQSLTSVTPVPATGELFLTSSVGGGSSAIPTENEAFVSLWDTKTEKETFRAQPLPGTRTYSKAIRARNGIIYGFAGNEYYAFDPVKRATIFTGKIAADPAAVLLADGPVGADGLIYGVERNEGFIFAINPADHSVRVLTKDKSLVKTHAMNVTADGVLYYTDGASLMRCKLN